ncbi:hypothetical protein NXS19_012932 [Fusarium pseudograminearum]|nr:hypothetical protein NXS19_012932 [Fusarium pseudograminearum]
MILCFRRFALLVRRIHTKHNWPVCLMFGGEPTTLLCNFDRKYKPLRHFKLKDLSSLHIVFCFILYFVKRAAMSVVNTFFYSTLTVALYCLVYRYKSTEPKKRVTRRNRPDIDVLYDPEDDPVNPTKANVDVVAVHGLGSDVDRTWTWRPDDPEQSVHWLKDSDMLRRKIPNARILAYNYDSTWLYDAPRVRAESCGKALIYGLDNFREREGTRDRPIIFLAHSFGGLVIQDGLVFADSMGRFEDILRYTAGFVSLGTPFRGSEIHWAADLAASVMRLYGSYRGCLSVLKYDNPELRYKTQCFGRLRKKYQFPMFCFFESLETTFIRLPFLCNYFKAIVVDEASACLSELARLPLETDHVKLNKYSSPEDQSYLRVSAEIVRMCNNAVAVMNGLNDESPSTDHGEHPSQHDEGVVGHQGSQDKHLEITSPFVIKNTR